MAEIIVDTRGLSCPEPVLMTKKALEKNKGGCIILIDNSTAFGNVQRFITKAKRNFVAEEVNGEYTIKVD